MTVKDLAEGLWPQVMLGEETPLTLVEATEETELQAATDGVLQRKSETGDFTTAVPWDNDLT